jgi:cell division protein FtsQ
MFKIYIWIKNLSLLLGLLILLSCIFVAEQKYSKQICKQINIDILKNTEQDFIKEKDILAYLSENKLLEVGTSRLTQIKSKQLEDIIKSHDFVRFCTVYKNWKGNIKIAILPKHVIARITCPYESDSYIDEQGEIVSLSPNYTARVLLVDSEILPKLRKHVQYAPYGKEILKILNLIDKDPFWKAQITYININDQSELTLYTQFNRQKVRLGKPANIENKMKKLKLFYTNILPNKGWNTYKQVNLKFDNQIVCE